jgi:hypothetical protein
MYKCNECGQELEAHASVEERDVVSVVPCETCIMNAENTGYQNGYADGTEASQE